MQTRKLVYLALVVALLLPAAVFAVAADGEETPMWVTRVRLAYNGRSSHSADRIVAMIHIRDADKDAVEGAEVTALWTLPDGSELEETAVTNEMGVAEFRVWAGRGVYQICVEDVAKEGWVYDAELNDETCDVLEVTVPFSPGK